MLLHQNFPDVERLLSKKETTTEETCEWPLNHSDRGNHWVVASTPLILKMLAYQYNKCEEQLEAWERAQREQWEADCNLRKELHVLQIEQAEKLETKRPELQDNLRQQKAASEVILTYFERVCGVCFHFIGYNI